MLLVKTWKLFSLDPPLRETTDKSDIKLIIILALLHFIIITGREEKSRWETHNAIWDTHCKEEWRQIEQSVYRMYRSQRTVRKRRGGVHSRGSLQKSRVESNFRHSVSILPGGHFNHEQLEEINILFRRLNPESVKTLYVYCFLCLQCQSLQSSHKSSCKKYSVFISAGLFAELSCFSSTVSFKDNGRHSSSSCPKQGIQEKSRLGWRSQIPTSNCIHFNANCSSRTRILTEHVSVSTSKNWNRSHSRPQWEAGQDLVSKSKG